MLSRPDIDRLLAHEGHPAVSLLLPTHMAGREIRQDPIRLRNLADRAAVQLERSGLRAADAEKLLEPARSLVQDYKFWRTQGHGLGVFLAPGMQVVLKLPIAVPEEAVVGRRFHIRHLLPALDPGARFLVLAVSARRARLFEATRSGMAELPEPSLPNGVEDVAAGTDYQTTRQVGDFGRPRTGSGTGQSMETSHSYEDPESVRKTQLMEYLRRVGTALQPLAGGDQLPIVLVAHPEIQGNFRAIAQTQNLLQEGLQENPDALDEAELHRRALALAEPQLTAARRAAEDRFRQLHGNGSALAATKPEEIVQAARFGRVDTLFVAVDDHLWGTIEEEDEALTAQVTSDDGDEDLLDYAAAYTLLKGGQVNAMAGDELPQRGPMVAIMRY